jgi:hypothetical protein
MDDELVPYPEMARFSLLVSRPGTVAMLHLVLEQLRDVPGEEVEIARRLVEKLRDAFGEEAEAIVEILGETPAAADPEPPASLPSIFDVRPINEDTA